MQAWGNKFIISVIPLSEERACGRMPDAMPRPSISDVMYLQYRQTAADDGGSEIDRVSKLSERFGAVIGDVLDGGGIRGVTTSAEFRALLNDRRDDIKVLLAYTHGHSGASIERSASGYTVVTDIAGERIDFSQQDFVTARQLSLWTAGGNLEVPYFVRRPFVFLNGCETGTRGSAQTTELSLPGTLLERGARAVVVTEAPIWSLFGFNFAKSVLERMAQGLEAGQAIYEARRDYWQGSKNPLGLLYSFYGNASVKFVEVSREHVLLVQQLLAQHDYDPGPLDGVLGSRTRAAIRLFQTESGVAPTGEIDDGLIRELQVAPPRIVILRRRSPELTESY